MNRTKMTRRTLTIIVVASTAVGLGACAIFWWCFEPMHLRVRLLCKTDHHALLEACQDLSNQVTDGKRSSGFYRIRPLPNCNVFGLPPAVRHLRPTSLFIDKDGRVVVEMFGGLSHFGVNAYPKDYSIPFTGFKYGDRELIPNLWYYDEDYAKYPEFDKYIAQMMERHGKEPLKAAAPTTN